MVETLTQLEEQLLGNLSNIQDDLSQLAASVTHNTTTPVVINGENVTLTVVSAAAVANTSTAAGSTEVLFEVGGADGTGGAAVYIPTETLEAAAGSNASDGPLSVLITVYSGALADAIMGDDTAGGGGAGGDTGGVSLSSSVVDVSLVGTDGARIELSGEFTVVPAMAHPPPRGGGTCLPSELLFTNNPDVTCIAGCCVEPPSSGSIFTTNVSDRFGTCMCRTPQHRGALCDVELMCELVQERGGLGEGERACQSSTTAGGMEACTCRRMGAVAIFAHTIYPATAINLDGNWPAKLSAGLSVRGGIVGAIAFVIASLVGLLSFEAWSRDRTALYSAQPPAWLRAPRDGWTMPSLLWHNLRLYHSLVRLYSTVPGHVPHTAMQNLVLLLCQWSLQAFMVVTFVGARQCTVNQTIFAGILSAASSAPIVVAGRLLFRHGTLESQALRRVFAANETLRRKPYPFRDKSLRDLAAQRQKHRTGAPGVRTTDLDRVILVSTDAGARSDDATLPTSSDETSLRTSSDDATLPTSSDETVTSNDSEGGPSSRVAVPPSLTTQESLGGGGRMVIRDESPSPYPTHPRQLSQRPDTRRTGCVYLHAEQLCVPVGRTSLGFFVRRSSVAAPAAALRSVRFPATVDPPPAEAGPSAADGTAESPYYFVPVDLVEGIPLRDCCPYRRATVSTGSEYSQHVGGGADEKVTEDSGRERAAEADWRQENPATRPPLCVWFDAALLTPIGLTQVRANAVPRARVALAAISRTPVSVNLVRQHRERRESNHRGGARAAPTESDAPCDSEWPPLRVWSCTPRLALAWALTLGVLAVTNFWLLYFVAVAFDEQLELQSKQEGEYLQGLLEAYGVAFAQSLLLQESLKVLVISLISPQMLPNHTELRVASRREALRLCVRALLNSVYGLLVFLL